ncbi:MAG TPA: hypothetical protein VK644_07085 [Chitinophagaceae bacterium]|nr:hypothetical protein [Chitinophagaceae bacterium]
MFGKRRGVALWLVAWLMSLPEDAGAQYYFYNDGNFSSNWILEMGPIAGIMNCLTDLGGRKGNGGKGLKDLNWQMSRPCAGLYLQAIYKEAFAWKMEGCAGNIESKDAVLRNTDPSLNGRYGRNLSFRSRIIDVHLALEIHPLFFRIYDQGKAPYFSPYLIGGIGYFVFNPKALLNGQWYALHPLRLEGQGFREYADHRPYRLQQVNIPVGIGLRYEVGAWTNIRLEFIHRVLFTDYLDDVSTNYINPTLFYDYLPPPGAVIAAQLYSRAKELQPGINVNSSMTRGNPENKDAFFTIQLKVGFLLRPRKN